jgi:hypothetical protein
LVVCCNTKEGPKTAIAYVESRVEGLSITQTDWHLIRQAAAGGGKLSNAIVTPERAAQAAGKLAHSYGDFSANAERFVSSFAQAKNTEGTCQALEHLADNGVPPEVLTRKRRGQKTSPPANSSPATCTVENLGRRDSEKPLYRIAFKGRTVTVAAGLAVARRIAERFEQSPRW